MKNFKSISIYVIIALLCTASAAGFFWSRSAASKAAESAKSAAAQPKDIAEELPPEVKEIVEKSAKIADPNPIIGIAKGSDYEAVTARAIENAGGLKDIIKAGDVVLIKPNLINGFPHDNPWCTDYRTVQVIADQAKALGASKIIVAEGSMSGNVFKQAEFDKLKDVELVDLNEYDKNDCYLIKPEKSSLQKGMYIPKIYMDADVVISSAKLKTHGDASAVLTLSLKNSFGVPSNKIYGRVGYKNRLHAMGVKDTIVDLNFIRRPDFVVIDGIIGGEGIGPLSNDPVKSNIVFAGRDPVAADTVAAHFMGYSVEEIPYLELARDKGLGVADLDKIRIGGGKLEQYKTKFKR